MDQQNAWKMVCRADVLRVELLNQIALDRPRAEALLRDVAAACRELDSPKVLIQCDSFAPDLSTMDLFRLAADLAEKGMPNVKIGIAVHHPNQDSRFFEDVAFNRGYEVRFFDRETTAEAWLTAGSRAGQSARAREPTEAPGPAPSPRRRG